jgi:hypothetical protein
MVGGARRRSFPLGRPMGARVDWRTDADVAQPVEHFTRNEGVRGSSPRVGSLEVPGNRLFLAPSFEASTDTDVHLASRNSR